MALLVTISSQKTTTKKKEEKVYFELCWKNNQMKLSDKTVHHKT